MEQEFFGSEEDSERGKREARKKYADAVARSFGETFNSPSGKLALEHLRKHLFGNVVLDRGPEQQIEAIRRDALRDAFVWIEGLARSGAKQETEAEWQA